MFSTQVPLLSRTYTFNEGEREKYVGFGSISTGLMTKAIQVE